MNDVIDRTAAAMTSAPDVDIAAGVMARLKPHRHAATWHAMACAAGVAAALLLAFQWSRNAPVEPTPVVAQTVRHLPAPEAPATTGIPAHTSSRERVRPATGISADEAAWLSRAVKPLDVAGAIAIESIQPPQPSIAPITVETFGPLPIEVPAIDVRSSGGR